MERDKDKLDFEVELTMFELYKDELVDLLQKKKKKPSLAVKLDSSGRVYIENGCSRIVTTPEELQVALNEGNSNRHVSATNIRRVAFCKSKMICDTCP